MLIDAYDFNTGSTIRSHILNNEKIEIHHIFPKAWCCEKHEIPQNKFRSSQFNSIINKTPLLARTNRMIGGVAPSKYLDKINTWSMQLPLFQEEPRADTPEDKLNSHLIPVEEFQDDDSEEFFEKRKEFLLKKIEKVMGKPVNRENEDSSD
ncbi:hypothetical protein F4009_19730 [Candidatus Poribacteria bacterium]|nr:hypothetical protein [Candidatus Poribacteria bacterium]